MALKDFLISLFRMYLLVKKSTESSLSTGAKINGICANKFKLNPCDHPSEKLSERLIRNELQKNLLLMKFC